jgi:tRNA dimethylallyltransferase
MKQLIVIIGPTAVGKTTLAIETAKHFNTEIISADSRQVYHELNIGVARPSEQELQTVKHHLIAHASIHQEYNAGQFERDALLICSELFKTKDIVVCCGGSMLYVDALVKGLDQLPSDKSVRNQLIKQLEEKGIESLQKSLHNVDPEYHNRVDLNNPHRLIRALEVCMVSGKKYSTLRQEAFQPRPFQTVTIGLTAQRNWLYSRINQRVDEMMSKGLLAEAEALFPFNDLNALNTVGYKELFEYFHGKMSLDEAIDKIKQHSRNFAKRQLTWWRRDESIHWLASDVPGNKMAFIESKITQHI